MLLKRKAWLIDFRSTRLCTCTPVALPALSARLLHVRLGQPREPRISFLHDDSCCNWSALHIALLLLARKHGR